MGSRVNATSYTTIMPPKKWRFEKRGTGIQCLHGVIATNNAESDERKLR
jgi:hypothetical protein